MVRVSLKAYILVVEVMKSPSLEFILIKIKLQVLGDRDVSVRELKCRKNENDSRS